MLTYIQLGKTMVSFRVFPVITHLPFVLLGAILGSILTQALAYCASDAWAFKGSAACSEVYSNYST